ncbi:MAG: LamG-like jellyroll fold domain-containing protein [Planctomycetota bacterium]|jgi:outer membrane lipoprotein-sorting protein
MSTHEQIKELLTDYVLRELSQQQSSEVKQHLADCQECRIELKKLQAILECADSMRELPVDEQVVKSAKESLLEAVADEETQQTTPGPTIRLDLIRSTIMKSRFTKLAAAAVIIIVAIIGISQITGSGAALADVIEKVEGAHAFIYKMKMTVSGIMMPGTPAGTMEQEATITISTDLGMKTEMTMTDPNSGEQTTQIMYVLPKEKAMFMIMPELKKYIRMELTEELLARMKTQNNDPRVMIRQMEGTEYTKLGPSIIDGVEVEGFETTDSAFGGMMGGDVKVTIWVDSVTLLPVLVEMDISMGEQMRMKGSMYDFEWDAPVTAEEFVPVIRDDFEPLVAGGMKMPSMNEEGAIEGLKLFAELAGEYPEELNMMTLMQLAGELRDTQSPAAEKIRKKLEKAKTDEERVAALMEIMQPIQSVGLFYMTLVADGNDPAYYGDKVTPEFPNAVLMRWKVEDDKYRVIFGDLTVEDVTADELAELEAAPLNDKPTAIKPQPADGAVGAELEGLQLSWMPGAYVNEHKVYFGTSAEQMTLLAEVADSCSVTAPALEKASTYYWCVDEVQPDGSVAAGDVWSFNTGKLVGFWELDGDANDSSGSGNHGTIVGEPNLVMGKVEEALQFDGIDDHIRTDYATDLPVWTVAIWVKSPVAPKKAAPSGPVHREKNLQISWNHSSADFRGVAGLRVANQWYAASFGELKADQWYHLAATYDGENLRAYTNGVLITDNSDPSGPPDKESATLKFAKHANNGDHFKGTIDDVRLYSYALTADEVAAIYADLKEEK